MAVEPSLILVFRVTGKCGHRKDNIFSSLDRNLAKLKTGSVGHFCLAVQIVKFFEKVNNGFLLKVYFTKDLEVADVGDRIGPDILRMKLIKIQNVAEEL
mgnify:CR=1 FL=1